MSGLPKLSGVAEWSGFTMSEIQLGAASHPERCVIAYPFNPPHLVPLVEIVGGSKTSEETIRVHWNFMRRSASARFVSTSQETS